jgi:hypothetical protein
MPARTDAAALPDERWDDPARGVVRFRTLLSAPGTPTDSIDCGIALMAAGKSFPLQSQPQAKGKVMTGCQPHRLAAGVALHPRRRGPWRATDARPAQMLPQLRRHPLPLIAREPK